MRKNFIVVTAVAASTALAAPLCPSDTSYSWVMPIGMSSCIYDYKLFNLNTRTDINPACFEKPNQGIVIPQKKDYAARYKKIAQSSWYKKAYEGKSLGDVISIEE